MNVIFFTDTDITPFMGGVERVTINLVRKLNERGHRCHLGFFSNVSMETCPDFCGKFHLQKDNIAQQLRNILVEQQINTCIINLGAKKLISFFNKTLFQVTRELGNIKVISGFYNYPGFELFGLSPALAWYRITNGQCNITTLNGFITTVCNKLHINGPIKHKIAQKLRNGLYSDEIVLLSENYISLYKHWIGENINHAFTAIGNPLSYAHNISSEDISTKEKIVLQVARFDDNFKRQTTALKIWKKIEDSGLFEDWKFIMVGYGPDEKFIKGTAQKLHLRNVKILPAQDPQELLKKSSIYMLTSAFEGLPMIVLDAQQFGVVPIGFDSFGAIHDVIDNHINGLIIENHQMDQYAEKMMWLMEHKAEREQMAQKGLSTCLKFATDKIVEKWERVLGIG